MSDHSDHVAQLEEQDRAEGGPDHCPTCGRRITDLDPIGCELPTGQRCCVKHAPWVVIPCSAAKAPGDGDMPARDRYVGPLHQLARAAALELTLEERVLVASARYGLLWLDDPTRDYDAQLGQLTPPEAELVRQRVRIGADRMRRADAGDERAQVIALTPAAYVELLASCPALERRLVQPLAGCGGIGGMRGRLAAIRDHRAQL